MGRGLSDLQRWILHRAGLAVKLSTVDILTGYFGWKRHTPRGYDLVKHNFSKMAVGARRFNVGKASLSRALRRLEQRGLAVVRHNWDAVRRIPQVTVELTDRGRQWLSVNAIP